MNDLLRVMTNLFFQKSSNLDILSQFDAFKCSSVLVQEKRNYMKKIKVGECSMQPILRILKPGLKIVQLLSFISDFFVQEQGLTVTIGRGSF